jgi:hypothetical protein
VENKPWYLSKTIWGAVLAVLGLALPKVATAIGGPDTISEIAGAAVTVIGSILAIIGRYRAVTTIGTTTNA